MQNDKDERELIDLRRRLAALTEEARKNEEAWQRSQRREMDLLDADSLDTLSSASRRVCARAIDSRPSRSCSRTRTMKSGTC